MSRFEGRKSLGSFSHGDLNSGSATGKTFPEAGNVVKLSSAGGGRYRMRAETADGLGSGAQAGVEIYGGRIPPNGEVEILLDKPATTIVTFGLDSLTELVVSLERRVLVDIARP